MNDSSALHNELRANLHSGTTIFAKLKEEGEPYKFERFALDRYGRDCIYYGFHLRDGRSVKRRVPLDELVAALKVLSSSGSLSRQDFRRICPVAESAGPSGYAVAGRILELLGVAQYDGHGQGFRLVNRDRALALSDR